MMTVSIEDGTREDNTAIVIRTAFGVDECNMDFAHAIERALDGALEPLGYARKTSTKAGGYMEWRYYQYAVAQEARTG